MYLIAGLGNPSKTYEGTRHNVGFSMIDALADAFQIDVTTKKHKAIVGRGVIEGMKVILAKPQTYMNLSGESIRAALDYYKTDETDSLIVIYDDISLDVGKLRIRAKGSAGGHNGMKDIIRCLGTDRFVRVKVGVGARPQDWDLADYVLSRFSDADRKVIDEGIEQAADAVEMAVEKGVDIAMNQYNKKKSASK